MPEQEPHDIGWAMRQLAAGRKVTRAFWKDHPEPGDVGYIWVQRQGWLTTRPDGGSSAPCLRLEDLQATDWELYEPEEPGHDFHWALEQIKAGNKVRRKCWVPGDAHWKQARKGGVVACWGGDPDYQEPPDITATEVDATDWVLV